MAHHENQGLQVGTCSLDQSFNSEFFILKKNPSDIVVDQIILAKALYEFGYFEGNFVKKELAKQSE